MPQSNDRESAAETGNATSTVPDPAAPVFFSHASPDAPLASALVAALEQSGVRCWIAPRDVEPGALYADEIIRAIDACQVLVVLLSAAAIASSHVSKEVERASSKRRRILVLRLDAAPLTRALEYFLSESHWIAVDPANPGAAATRLAKTMQYRPRTAISDTPVAGARPRFRAALWTGALVAGLCVAVALWKAWAPRASGNASLEQSAPSVPHSVAVLPFLDLSANRDQAYFADGLTEELIDLLAAIPELQVTARTSSFSLRDKSLPLAEIAKALGVTHVLEGSVRQSQDSLRITAQLIDAASGYHLWSLTFDERVEDVFKVQDDIAKAVAGALKLSARSAHSTITGTRNARAYNLFLQAQYVSRTTAGADDNEKARQLLEEALQLDPNFGMAWALASRVYDDVHRPADAHRAIERALVLDPDNPDVHTQKARSALNDDLDIEAAQTHIRRSLELRPNNPFALSLQGIIDQSRGELGSGIDATLRATRLDPANSARFRDLGLVYFFAGRYSEARAAWSRVLELDPHPFHPHWFPSILLLAEGKPSEAIDEFSRDPADDREPCGCAVIMYDAAHRTSEADAALADLKRQHADDSAFAIAEVYASRGDPDQAFAWLERAYRQREGDVMYLKVDPYLTRVHNDARYREFLARLKLN